MLQPLTADEKKHLYLVKSCYADFWNNIKFRKGWAKPALNRSHVEHDITRAAEIVTRIRSTLKNNNPEMTLRMVDGTAREYLWSVDVDPTSSHEKEMQFVRNLVHATFKDGRGYTDKLDEATLDKYFHEINDQIEERALAEKIDLMKEVEAKWERTCELIEQESPTLLHTGDPKAISQHDHDCLTTLVRGLETVIQTLENRRYFINEASGDGAPVVGELTQENVGHVHENVEDSVASNYGSTDGEDDIPTLKRTITGSSNILKVERVSEDVNQFANEIRELHEEADHLDFESLQKNPLAAKEALSKVQQKALVTSESLMKDLLELDTIVGMTEEERPAKKQAVNNINNLLSDLEGMQKKLHDIQKEMVQREKVIKEAAAAAKPKEESATPPKKREASSDAESVEVKKRREECLKNKWKGLKLKPRMDVKDHGDAYTITAYVPGMGDDDIELQLTKGGTVLKVSGTREPSEEEVEQMKARLQALIEQDPEGRYFAHDEPMDALLLRIAAGRYGTFSESFRLNETVDVSNIQATYEGGLLQVVIPRKKEYRRIRQHPRLATQYPSGPLDRAPPRSFGQFGYRDPYGNLVQPAHFFGDNDLFW